MADIGTVWNVQAGEGDWALAVQPQGLSFVGSDQITFTGSGGIQFVDATFISTGLASGPDLFTAVYISLFTDRRAESSDVIPDGSTDRRGWWGDGGQDYLIGSRLWLLSRAKQVPQTLLDAKGYCTEALAWMIADGVAAKIDVACSFIGQGAIGILIKLYDQAGGVIASFQWAWKGLV